MTNPTAVAEKSCGECKCETAAAARPDIHDLAPLNEILSRYGDAKGSLIPVLQDAQKTYGYLPENILEAIAGGLNIPLSRIYGVVTFYSQFYLIPRGRHIIKSCQGTACHVRGAGNILSAIENELKIKAGETTDDFRYSIDVVACVGTCFLAPVVVIDNDYYGELKQKQVKRILKSYQ